jgi:hypothetical protein
MYGVFPTHFAMDPLVIKAVVAAINIAHLVAVEVAQNPVKRSRKRRKVQKEANVDFALLCFSLCRILSNFHSYQMCNIG